MIIDLIRYSTKNNSQFGLLSLDGVFECYALENLAKIFPVGEYDLELQKVGHLNDEYSKTYGAAYHGMLHIKNIPNRDGIMIHVANRADQLEGCVATGKQIQDDQILVSNDAYISLYAKVSAALVKGSSVKIRVRNIKEVLGV